MRGKNRITCRRIIPAKVDPLFYHCLFPLDQISIFFFPPLRKRLEPPDSKSIFNALQKWYPNYLMILLFSPLLKNQNFQTAFASRKSVHDFFWRSYNQKRNDPYSSLEKLTDDDYIRYNKNNLSVVIVKKTGKSRDCHLWLHPDRPLAGCRTRNYIII